MAAPIEIRVMSSGSITAAATADTDMVPCLGAKAVAFLILGSQVDIAFAASAAFALKVTPRIGATTLTGVTVANHGLALVPSTPLNNLNTDDGVVVFVTPASGAPFLSVYEIGATLKAGAANITDLDVWAYIFN